MGERLRVRLTSGTGLLGTGRFLLGSKKDSSGGVAGEEWLAFLFVPLVPRRALSLRTATVHEDGVVAAVEDSRPLSASEMASRYSLSLAGLAGVALALATIDRSSANTGLLGGLLVVCGGGALVAAAGFLDWLRPRVEACSRTEG